MQKEAAQALPNLSARTHISDDVRHWTWTWTRAWQKAKNRLKSTWLTQFICNKVVFSNVSFYIGVCNNNVGSTLDVWCLEADSPGVRCQMPSSLTASVSKCLHSGLSKQQLLSNKVWLKTTKLPMLMVGPNICPFKHFRHCKLGLLK